MTFFIFDSNDDTAATVPTATNTPTIIETTAAVIRAILAHSVGGDKQVEAAVVLWLRHCSWTDLFILFLIVAACAAGTLAILERLARWIWYPIGGIYALLFALKCQMLMTSQEATK